MELGAFSVSLAVRDLETSKSFYQKLGFEVFGGDVNATELADFDDVRTIQHELESAGLELDQRIGDDDSGSGPASIMVTDPDGNVILIDQHV